ncbi:hypothetical protein KUTeg_017639 [Tegillarca granosa]|uniref:LEM domain-containing protein n=1 Tax=Tegillarca granosa TaxID=220873 RepID=A0ABQ9EFH6_TEGGR|nr:hypothetical protein KUTeg_017639 [Tegillarca granosa]
MAETSKVLFDCLNADNLRDAESTLIDGADPNFILPVEGVAPIHLAAGLGYEATRLLLQYGGDPNIRSAEGSTPLHVAATWGDRECLQLLLQNGGDPFIQDQEGNNVLQTCKIYQHEDCFNLLESYLLLLTPDDMYQPEIIYQCRNPVDSFDDTGNPVNSFNDPLEKNHTRHPVRRKTILNSDYLDDYLYKALTDRDKSGSYDSEIQRHIDQLIRSTRQVSLDVTSPGGDKVTNTQQLPVKQSVSTGSEHQANTDATIIYDWKDNYDKLNNCEIHEKLRSLGDDPGPVTTCTRQTYLSRLRRLSQDPSVVTLKLTTSLPDYPKELCLALEGKFEDMDEMESKMVSGFQNPNKNRRWREGTLKSSFNYLLLDPRVTCNLPNRISTLGDLEGFKVFVEATFYIGKVHSLIFLSQQASEKVQRIIDIWKEGLGVVSLHCFQSVIPVEAYTREACMVDAIGLQHLTNKKRGDYYGVSTTWTLKQKQKIGVHLLRKCFKIFLHEGERQLCIGDVK